MGCRFSEEVVFPEYFAENPDARVPEYQTPTGIYAEGIGWVKEFQPFDLYSKDEDVPDLAQLVPEYRELIAEAFPTPLSW